MVTPEDEKKIERIVEAQVAPLRKAVEALAAAEKARYQTDTDRYRVGTQRYRQFLGLLRRKG